MKKKICRFCWSSLPVCSRAHLSFAVEAQDLKADAGRASRLDLVQMSEEVESRSASAVVQFALRQDAQQR